MRVKPKAKLIGRIRGKVKLGLEVRATDAAGNSSALSRVIVVKPPKRRH